MNNDRKIFEEIQAFLRKPETDVAPRGLCVPVEESELHSLETDVIRQRLNEARARQHLLKQFSAEEIAHLQFVDEAVAVLNYRTLTEGVVPFPKKSAGKFASGDRVSVEFYQGGSKKSRGTAKIDRVSDSYAWAKVDGETVQVLQSTGQEPVASKADYFKFVKESADMQEAKEQRARITGEEITESEELYEISGDLASDVHRKRQNQAFENPTPENSKLADKAHSSYIKRMVRDVYRGKTADDINKGYASDAEKNTKRGWSNESEELDELSNVALGKYKSAAGKAASAADAAGDYKTGNKRFSGIMKATKKQFANDEKKIKTESEELEEAIKPGSMVKISSPGHPMHGKVGAVGIVHQGIHSKAAKQYTVDFEDGDRKQSAKFDKKQISAQKNESVELDEAAYDPTTKTSLKDRTPRQQAAIDAYKRTKPKQSKVIVHLDHEDGTVSKQSMKMKHGDEDEAKKLADGHLKNMQYIHDQFPKTAGPRATGVKKYEIKESVELEELSAKTLGSYVKKATVDVAQNSYNSGRKVHEPKEYHKSKQAAKSRIQGVMRAANKLSARNENSEPLDRKLWAELTEQARAEFDAYPSIASAGWIAREYSAQGGEWSNEDSE